MTAQRRKPGRRWWRLRGSCVAGAAVLLASCVFTQLELRPVEPKAMAGQNFPSGLKVHLHDGSTIVYAKGASASATTVTGDGTRYALDLSSQPFAAPIALDSIAAAEWYAESVNRGATNFAGGVVAVGVLMVVAMLLVIWLVSNMFSGANLTGF